MKTKGKSKMGGVGEGEDDVKPCRMRDLRDAPLQAVPRLAGKVRRGPTLSREGSSRPGTGGKKAEPYVGTSVIWLMNLAPFGTGHVRNSSCALAANLEKMWSKGPLVPCPPPSLVSAPGTLPSEVVLVFANRAGFPGIATTCLGCVW